jgi:hypothetical protein
MKRLAALPASFARPAPTSTAERSGRRAEAFTGSAAGAYTALVRPAAALLVLVFASAPAGAEVAVRVSGGLVELTATAAPLADVLDRLARQTGMKVVYEGPAPRQLVTLSLHGRTPTEVVLDVLEGLGVNFAFVADPSGARVQTLMLAGTASASSATASAGSRPAATAGPRRPYGPPPGASPEVEPAFEEPEEDPGTEDQTFPGLPPGAEGVDPNGVPVAPDPGQMNPPAPSAVPPGAGMVPAPSMPTFPSSPFAPQALPLPQPPAAVPGAPAQTPGQPVEGPVPTVPPPP